MTEAEIRMYIRRALGNSTVDLELETDDLNDALDAAKAWYAAYVGQLKSDTVTLISETTEYSVPSDCDYVTQVVTDAVSRGIVPLGWPLSTYNFSWLFPGSGSGNGSMAIADMVQGLQYYEQAQRTASADVDWFYDSARRILVVTPSGKNATRARIWYLTNAIDIATLRYSEIHLVRDYALAHAMEILGFVRTKYSEVPNAIGGTTMNGDLLVSEASDRKRTLTEQLLRMQPPASFILG